jgi:hypothetical protein
MGMDVTFFIEKKNPLTLKYEKIGNTWGFDRHYRLFYIFGYSPRQYMSDVDKTKYPRIPSSYGLPDDSVINNDEICSYTYFPLESFINYGWENYKEFDYIIELIKNIKESIPDHDYENARCILEWWS